MKRLLTVMMSLVLAIAPCALVSASPIMDSSANGAAGLAHHGTMDHGSVSSPAGPHHGHSQSSPDNPTPGGCDMPCDGEYLKTNALSLGGANAQAPVLQADFDLAASVVTRIAASATRAPPEFLQTTSQTSVSVLARSQRLRI